MIYRAVDSYIQFGNEEYPEGDLNTHTPSTSSDSCAGLSKEVFFFKLSLGDRFYVYET